VHIETFNLRGKFSGEIATEQQLPNVRGKNKKKNKSTNMNNELINSERLKEVFSRINEESNDEFVKELSEIMTTGNIFRSQIDLILEKYSIDYVKDKGKILDTLLRYMEIVLEDDILTQEELFCIKQFKRIFKIKEGDFYENRSTKIVRIMIAQLYKIYIDKKVDKTEALHKVSLQDLFDLNYDQFNEFDLLEVENVLNTGANIADLDTFVQSYSNKNNFNRISRSRTITREVMEEVFIRDKGKCQVCGSSENLEFDHVLPFSKGGNNTSNNIQLLCFECNRKKSANFGTK